jgi:hypothetical protein
MKRSLLVACILLVSFLGFGQCPTSAINLNNQTDVDNFAINYPGCTEITHGIYVFGASNLNGLNQLTSIASFFNIFNSPMVNFTGLGNVTTIERLEVENSDIVNFEGLSSLTSLGLLQLKYNDALINFEGLESITTLTSLRVEDHLVLSSFFGLHNLEGVVDPVSNNVLFWIFNNPNIIDMTGLESLEVIDGSPRFSNNDALVSLSGFDSLLWIDGSLRILGNDVLNDISAIGNVDNITGTFLIFIIEDNPSLSQCDIDYVCQYIDHPDAVFMISNNAPGCNSKEEIEEQCEILDIPDVNFLSALLNHNPVIDTNSDSNIQYSEAEAFTGAITANNQNISDFSGLEEFVNITGFNGAGNQTVTLRLDENTALTSVIFENNSLLEAVNLKNGNNTIITNFQGLNCPSLQFVCVDDVAFAEANFTNIEAHVAFTTDCGFLAVPTFDIQKSVIMFPNPVSEKLQIHLAEGIAFEKATVYSILGEQLFFTSEETIDCTQLTVGIYFVEVTTDRGAVTKKIVKE